MSLLHNNCRDRSSRWWWPGGTHLFEELDALEAVIEHSVAAIRRWLGEWTRALIVERVLTALQAEDDRARVGTSGVPLFRRSAIPARSG